MFHHLQQFFTLTRDRVSPNLHVQPPHKHLKQVVIAGRRRSHLPRHLSFLFAVEESLCYLLQLQKAMFMFSLASSGHHGTNIEEGQPKNKATPFIFLYIMEE